MLQNVIHLQESCKNNRISGMFKVYCKLCSARFLLDSGCSVKPIQKKIFEIKSNELSLLFKYKEGQIIVVGVVFVKKTQKTPKEKIKLAETRLKEV